MFVLDHCMREGCRITKDLSTCTKCKWHRYCGREHQKEDWNFHKENCFKYDASSIPDFMRDRRPPELHAAQELYYDTCEIDYDNYPENWYIVKENMEEALGLSVKCSDAWAMLSTYYRRGPEKDLQKALQCANDGLAQGLWYRPTNAVGKILVTYGHIKNRGYLRLYYQKYDALYEMGQYQEAADTLTHLFRLSHSTHHVSVYFLVKDYVQIRYLLNTFKDSNTDVGFSMTNLLYNFCKYRGLYDDESGQEVTMNDLERIFTTVLKASDQTPHDLLNPRPTNFRITSGEDRSPSRCYVEDEHGYEAWASVDGALDFLASFHKKNVDLPSEADFIMLLKYWGNITVVTKTLGSILCTKKEDNVIGRGLVDFKFAQGFYDDEQIEGNQICVFVTCKNWSGNGFKYFLYSDVVEVPYWHFYYDIAFENCLEAKRIREEIEDAAIAAAEEEVQRPEKEKANKKKLQKKRIKAAQIQDTIAARSSVIRSGVALDIVFGYLLGNVCEENHKEVLQQLRRLCMVSQLFRETAEINWQLKSLVFSSDLTVCGYGDDYKIDRFYDYETIGMIRAFSKYGGKFLLDISLSARVLEDELLTVVARECKLLERFELSYTIQERFDNPLKYQGRHQPPGHVCFSAGALVHFFNEVNLLTHVHFYAYNIGDKEIMEVESCEVFAALKRHPLVSLKVSVVKSNWDALLNLMRQKYVDPEGRPIESLHFTFEDQSKDATIRGFMGAFCSEIVSDQSASSLHSLRCLTLHNCDINDEILSPLWQSLPNLRSLSIVPVWGENFENSQVAAGITSKTLDLLSRYCSLLTYLDVHSQKFLDAPGISRVIDACKNLMHLDISYTRVPLESILGLNPIKVVPISRLHYGGDESVFLYGDEGKRSERQRIQKFIKGYPQILFCHPMLGLVDRDSNHPLVRLSKEHAESEEISNGFKRSITVFRLTSDESIAQFRAKVLEFPVVRK